MLGVNKGWDDHVSVKGSLDFHTSLTQKVIPVNSQLPTLKG